MRNLPPNGSRPPGLLGDAVHRIAAADAFDVVRSRLLGTHRRNANRKDERHLLPRRQPEKRLRNPPNPPSEPQNEPRGEKPRRAKNKNARHKIHAHIIP